MQRNGVTSQSELARLSGVNQSIISKILTGKNETSKFSGKIAAALGISADWLINGSGMDQAVWKVMTQILKKWMFHV
ncbi:helix-turn-helix domain-containing protein [Ewingella americana]